MRRVARVSREALTEVRELPNAVGRGRPVANPFQCLRPDPRFFSRFAFFISRIFNDFLDFFEI